MALNGSCIPAGTYTAKLIRGKEEYFTQVKLVTDTASPYSAEDREAQRILTWRLFRLSERLAFIYASLDIILDQCEVIARLSPEMAKKVSSYQKEVDFNKEFLVAMGGDGFLNQDERLR